MFQLSLDNPTMMEIYTYGGVLAYIKYHYTDGVLKQNLMLMDKTRYDHNKGDRVAVAKRPKSEEETKSLVSMFIGSKDKEIAKVRKEIGD